MYRPCPSTSRQLKISTWLIMLAARCTATPKQTTGRMSSRSAPPVILFIARTLCCPQLSPKKIAMLAAPRWMVTCSPTLAATDGVPTFRGLCRTCRCRIRQVQTASRDRYHGTTHVTSL
ncbi:hypothetical protein F5Y16DRAFT_387665 [Xylariaceae sp. FL0255]|nr:hypothetical protein F5Y16DRAFT_387665 [Xylariaceae sp. FL0255]